MQKSSPIEQIYPETSFVEENANEIYAETLSSLVEILENADDIRSVAGIGITNQRETIIAWDKETGKPLYNAIVWQCRRTAEYMRNLGETHGEFLRKKTGLLPDAYFSATCRLSAKDLKKTRCVSARSILFSYTNSRAERLS